MKNTKKIRMTQDFPVQVPVQQVYDPVGGFYVTPRKSPTGFKKWLRKRLGVHEFRSVNVSDVVLGLTQILCYFFVGIIFLGFLSLLVVVLQIWFFVIVGVIVGLILFVRWFPKYLNS